jgi:uncharacterized membrane protein YecN with MAPEG domain
MPLPITSATAAVVALLLLFLAVQTVRQRLRAKQAFGDGGDKQLIYASRSHGNLAEHAPIVLIMIGLLENSGANPNILKWVAIVFVVARIAHAIGLHQPSEPGKAPLMRQIGVVVTWVVMLGLAGHILFRVFA